MLTPKESTPKHETFRILGSLIRQAFLFKYRKSVAKILVKKIKVGGFPELV